MGLFNNCAFGKIIDVLKDGLFNVSPNSSSGSTPTPTSNSLLDNSGDFLLDNSGDELLDNV